MDLSVVACVSIRSAPASKGRPFSPDTAEDLPTPGTPKVVDAYVGELVVDEQTTGHGVGRALMEAAECWARSAGHRRLSVETGAANLSARAFYAALGYAEEEVVLSRAL